MTRQFARHVRTRVWHITCQRGAVCKYNCELDRSVVCDVPPEGDKICCACLDHARAHNLVPLTRLLHELEK